MGLEKENIYNITEVFTPTERHFSEELLKCLGYQGDPPMDFTQVSKEINQKIGIPEYSDPDVISIPIYQEGQLMQLVSFVNKLNKPETNLDEIGIYFLDKRIFDGELCKAQGDTALKLFLFLSADLLKEDVQPQVTDTLEELLLNSPE